MSKWKAHVQNPRRQKAIAIREQVERGIDRFFRDQGFAAVRTPLMVRSPGMEPMIRPFRVTPSGQPAAFDGPYLQTSPEFAMKKLLAGGIEKLFQICPAFRSEPYSVTHHPEFTILEFYRAHTNDEGIMRDTEQLFAYLAREIHGKEEIRYQGRTISVAPPWPRLQIRQIFRDMLGIELFQNGKFTDLAPECKKRGLTTDASDSWDDLYFKLWLNFIEPELPKDRAVFVTRYPASQAALSVIDADPDGSLWARRFELYAGGLELGNAFQELTDPVEQRRRFERDMEYREKTFGPDFPKNPIDEDFLDALGSGFPPSGGIAIGVDRMVMLFADETDIDYTLWLPSYSGTGNPAV